jgi:hypothetical protein
MANGVSQWLAVMCVANVNVWQWQCTITEMAVASNGNGQ